MNRIQLIKILRIIAGTIDLAVVLGLIFLCLYPKLGVLKFGGIIQRISLLLPIIYLLLKDSIDGKSFGKHCTGITVYNVPERKVAGIADSFIRNVCLVIPILMPLIMLQILVKNSRWGDGLANTVVIHDSDVKKGLTS